ncbi:unnamed protein product [Scytosiphon promiscuus]
MSLASWMLLRRDDEDPMFQARRLADFNQAADFLDGPGRTGRSLPHAERCCWEKTGRNLSNAHFKTAFPCRCLD